MEEALYVGLVVLEGTLSSVLLVTNSSGTPIDADALPTFRVYGEEGYLINGTCSLLDTGSITDASNTAPIVITSAAHGLTTGARVTIASVVGNTAANGTFVVTRVDANTFSLVGSTGNGAWTSGGTWHATGAYAVSIACIAANGFEVGQNFQVVFNYALSATAQGQVQSFTCT